MRRRHISYSILSTHSHHTTPDKVYNSTHTHTHTHTHTLTHTQTHTWQFIQFLHTANGHHFLQIIRHPERDGSTPEPVPRNSPVFRIRQPVIVHGYWDGVGYVGWFDCAWVLRWSGIRWVVWLHVGIEMVWCDMVWDGLFDRWCTVLSKPEENSDY